MPSPRLSFTMEEAEKKVASEVEPFGSKTSSWGGENGKGVSLTEALVGVRLMVVVVVCE